MGSFLRDRSIGISRREFLAGSVSLAALVPTIRGETVAGSLPWTPGAVSSPQAIDTKVWHFFMAEEVASIEALVECLIPRDPETPGGKDAGCAAFIDGQLAGPFGSAEGIYMQGPFEKGTPEQGLQSRAAPAEIYRAALKSLDSYCRTHFVNGIFAALRPVDQASVLSGLEHGTIILQGVDGKLFFELLLQNTIEGFFSDPLYGGNRGMVGWRMLGFPGARYDYRDYVDEHNRRLNLEPISILSRL